ncbi:O-antigen ligase family protein [Rhodopirellula bahusiensis]|uniref:Capsule biosynthesis protein CapJ n=1 Tax=Rhodopirellula bahusiensis TaxID=2014065 RepID=A0A2G1W807_9BACT|nr:O-antigen ligase family protein [Rhodopirellula bahusiensis]PHQ34960.1 capsule biosynthesis protein CapJ [Rhodopirellula bahusiensis]
MSPSSSPPTYAGTESSLSEAAVVSQDASEVDALPTQDADERGEFEPPSAIGSEPPSGGGFITAIVFAVVMLAMFINPIEFKTSAEFDRATSNLNVLTLAKLALAAAASGLGAIAVFVSPRTRQLLGSLPGLGLLALGALFCATSLFAIESNAMISRASAMIFVGYLLFTAMALATLGPRKMLAAIVAGTSLYMLLTWGLFLLVPEMGTFEEYISATETVQRMGGTGHPNNIAKTAIAIVLVGVAMYLGRNDSLISVGLRGPWQRLILIGIMVLAAATVVATLSRTAMLAGAAAGGILLIDRLYGRGGLALGIFGIASAASLVLAISLFTGKGPFSESAVSAVTKSGDVEELTSLTGRTTIWEEAIGFIVERPLTGYGMDSAASVMSREATGTHNLLLHVTFSAGVIACLVMILMLGWSLVFGATSPHEWIRTVLTYVLVSGLVEDTIIESFPTTLTVLWMAALLAPTLAGRSQP